MTRRIITSFIAGRKFSTSAMSAKFSIALIVWRRQAPAAGVVGYFECSVGAIHDIHDRPAPPRSRDTVDGHRPPLQNYASDFFTYVEETLSAHVKCSGSRNIQMKPSKTGRIEIRYPKARLHACLGSSNSPSLVTTMRRRCFIPGV